MGINTTDIRNFDILDYWEQPARDAYNEDGKSHHQFTSVILAPAQKEPCYGFVGLVLKLLTYYNYEGTQK